ncbi:MAG: response regulator [Pirellulales bacterium]
MIPDEAATREDPCWPTILCIDDDPQITEAIRIRLRQYEVVVLCASHGMHGFWLAMTERPDLIVTDMHMPQGAGDYVVECLRNNSDTRSIPVIVLTGQRGPDVQRQLSGLDVDMVLTKPVLFDKLRDAIAVHVPLRERDYAQIPIGQPA